jgi:radical SAM-linked protein
VTFWLVTFSRSGPASFLSHLDTARALQRAFARAAVPIALSQGMRPKPRLSLPLPLPVGAAGREELAVVEVAPGGPDPVAALRALRAAASPGLEPSAITVVEQGHPRPQPKEAEYTCVVDGDTDALLAAVVRYGREERVQYERVSPKGRRTFDLKEFVGDAAAEPVTGGAQVRFTVHHRTDGAARPQEFVGLIARWAGTDPAMRRLERERIRWQTSPADLERAGRSVTP